MQRRQRIHDALRTLGPYVDPVLYQRAREAARAGYVQEDDADGVAGAVAISAALSTYRRGDLDLPSPTSRGRGAARSWAATSKASLSPCTGPAFSKSSADA
ncbi:DUF6545 domain-containing protein [Streptomyces violaceoruber]|uniref:DUF6545 domain-containing protein n=1 Tax=Streptomyces violaceoruber TaxID=1935 RepID=UPI000AC43761|nr:DUF6545 domain-containing protein [Streptomyces violaceoruber]